MRVGIIADDYTGAADTGVQFSKKRLKTSIVRDLKRIEKTAERVDVLVFDTESRGDPKEVAYKKVALAAEEFKKTGVEIIYKKIDSTLRGNLGVELDAAIDTLNVSAVILCPAYPKNGRITVGGFHLNNQSLIEDTEVANDPESPVRQSHIPTLIQNQSEKKVSLIDIASVSLGMERVKREVVRQLKEGNQIIVVDAISQRDLKTIAQTIASLDQPVLVCGSGGLAEELPDAFGLVEDREEFVVVIAGSVSEVTAQQIRIAAKTLNVKVVTVDVQRVLMGKEEGKLEATRVIDEAEEALHAGRDVVIRLAESLNALEEVKEAGKELGLTDREMRTLMGQILGRTSQAILKKGKLCGMVVTGGETAFNVYKALDVLEVRVEEEVLPGIPVVTIVGGPASGTRVVTKAGAFGNEDALVTAIEYLRKKR
ncbi:MAG: four-carbon acid sugar kinase family protein [Candidatus Bathyarchaeia archaeon]